MPVQITAKTEAAKAFVAKIAAGLTPAKVDPIMEESARMTQAGLVAVTPKKWFGQARAGWVQPASVIKPAEGVRIVQWNQPPGTKSPIMFWLEEGTKDHGPVTKKALFIPLTRRAVTATQGIYGVGTVDEFTVGGETYWETRPAIFQKTQSIRKGKVKNGSRALIYGIDYILAKRVKGIAPRRIVASFRPKAQEMTRGLMVTYIRSLIKS